MNVSVQKTRDCNDANECHICIRLRLHSVGNALATPLTIFSQPRFVEVITRSRATEDISKWRLRSRKAVPLTRRGEEEGVSSGGLSA